MTLPIRVIPRSSHEGLGGERGGALVVRLTAPPVGGKANRALKRFLSEALGVPGNAVSLVQGENRRQKLVRIEGISLEDLGRLLNSRGRVG